VELYGVCGGRECFGACGWVISFRFLVWGGCWVKRGGHWTTGGRTTRLTNPGYAARIPLTDNPWNKHAFETQIVAIILAPTLLCISIYLTLKHVCLSLSPALSRLRPNLYPFVFVPLDVSCLLVQAIGGALAASAALNNAKMVMHGNRCIIAGIVLQVVVLLGFGTTVGDYYLRVKKW